MSFDLGHDAISFDWFILALRIAFIGLVYVFLYQIARVTMRELVKVATVPGASIIPASASASPVISMLEVLDPAQSSLRRGERIPLDLYSTIGRRQDNSIVLDDTFVSNRHAEIVYDGGSWWLEDIGSTNGTIVNDVRATSRIPIGPGDIVQFGRVVTRMTQ
ncbi:MAG TPA: FHA domain-containing protein [Thermomicrobiales bacterium]|nr:FHA domain-containing protein [Thermomicrobiales bacterium]